MKMLKVLSLGLMAAGMTTMAHASANISPGAEGSLIETATLYPLTVGVDVDGRTRTLDIAGTEIANAEFSARSLTAYVGMRVLPWLVPFATIGTTKTDVLGFESGDDELLWSLGLQAAIWQQDIVHPEWAEGRISLRAVLERVEGDLSTESGIAGDWSENNLSLLVGYELFVDKPYSRDTTPYSLQLYAGPGWSDFEGSARIGGANMDLEANQMYVTIVGADLFLSDNVSIGGLMRIGSDTDWRVGLRFHF